jgi:hypothetical protein
VQDDTTYYWSSIRYVSPSGVTEKVVLSEYEGDVQTLRYTLVESSLEYSKDRVAYLDSFHRDGSNHEVRMIRTTVAITMQGTSRFALRNFYTGDRIDSIADTLYGSGFPRPILTSSLSRISRSADGNSDSTYRREVSSTGSRTSLIRVETRDSTARTTKVLMLTAVYSPNGVFLETDTARVFSKYLDTKLEYDDYNILVTSTGRNDSQAFVYKNGLFLDSAYIYRNGTLLYKGKYEYKRLNVRREVEKQFGLQMWPI